MLGASLLLATDTPTTRGWATVPQSFTVRDPSGAAVTGDAAEKIQQTLGDEAYISVERGFQREDVLVVAILLGVFGAAHPGHHADLHGADPGRAADRPGHPGGARAPPVAPGG